MAEVYLGEFTKAIQHGFVTLEFTFCVYVTRDLDILVERRGHRWITPHSDNYVNISNLEYTDDED